MSQRIVPVGVSGGDTADNAVLCHVAVESAALHHPSASTNLKDYFKCQCLKSVCMQLCKATINSNLQKAVLLLQNTEIAHFGVMIPHTLPF